jgi:SLT domain-containing protein
MATGSVADVYLRLRVDSRQLKKDIEEGAKGSSGSANIDLKVNKDALVKDIGDSLKKVDATGAGKRIGGDLGSAAGRESSAAMRSDFLRANWESLGGVVGKALGSSAGDTAAKEAPERTRRGFLGIDWGGIGRIAGRALGGGAGDGGESGGKSFGEKFASSAAKNITVKRTLITAAVGAALAVGPAGIALGAAAAGVGIGVALVAGIISSIDKQRKTVQTQLDKLLTVKNPSGDQKQQIADLQKQLAVLNQQAAAYARVTGAARGVRDTLIATLTVSLKNSGILEAFSRALQATGTWIAGHRALFTAFFAAAAPYVPVLTNFFLRLVGTLLPQMTALMQRVQPAVQHVLDAFIGFVRTGVGGFLTQVGTGAGVSAGAFGKMLVALAPLLPAIGQLATLTAQLVNRFPILIPVIGGLLVAVKVAAAVNVLSRAFDVAKAAAIALGISMDTIPFVAIAAGIAIAAVLIITHWGAVQRFLVAAWHAIYGGAVAPMINFFTNTIPHAAGLVLNWLKANWPYIAGYLGGPVGIAAAVIYKHWGTIQNTFTAGWRWLLSNVWTPVFNFFTRTFPAWLGAAARFVLNVFVRPWQNLLVSSWRWLLASVWTPVFNLFTRTLPSWFDAAVRFVRSRFVVPWQNLLSASWRWLLASVWTPVFNFFTRTLPQWLGTAVNFVRSRFVVPWQNLFSASWAWLTGHVWNPVRDFFTRTLPSWFDTAAGRIGQAWQKIQNIVLAPVKWLFQKVFDPLGTGFDNITSALGLGKPIKVPVVAGWAAGGSPGRIFAGTHGTADDVLARVSRGETIVSAAHSRVLAPAFSAVGVPGYAAGGIPNPVSSITGAAKSVIGAAKGVIGKAVDTGKIAAAIATGNTTALVNAVTQLIAGKSYPGAVGDIARILTAAPKAIVKDMAGWLIGSGSGQGGGGYSAGSVPNVGSGVARWRGIVLQALSLLHMSAGLASRILYQMQTESAGNPNAINNWDINAKRGDPSRGLMQVIGSTFAAYHVAGTSSNIYDPLANVAAAVNYARHVYGPSLGALGSGHGYYDGGPITEPIVGIGASGRRYTFGEGGSQEHVVSQATMAALVAEQRRTNALLEAQPARTAGGVAAAVSGARGLEMQNARRGAGR